ncbi:MAG: carbohydrate-binding protein, partial [Nitrospirota bacterium]
MQLITFKFHYHAPEAGEVWLVWGINGWQQAPDTMRPPGTIVPDKAMQTPLVRTNNTFAITIQVPSGTVIDYGFLIT